jgi:hypothetical protein
VSEEICVFVEAKITVIECVIVGGLEVLFLDGVICFVRNDLVKEYNVCSCN